MPNERATDEELTPADCKMQQWIDSLLTSPAVTGSAPAALHAEMRLELNRKRRRAFA